MGTKTSVTLGAFAILALLIAGVSYRVIRENSLSAPPPRNVAEAPPPPVQSPSAPENSPPIEQEKQAADASPQTSPPSTAPAAPSPAPSAPPTTAGQSKEVPTPPSSPSTSAAPEQSRQVTSEKPPSAAMALAIPDEDKMSEANRRQVQEALHGLGYYNGPIDGIFGPLTRASIRRFQDSIGEKETGLLTAAEAGRLVSGTGLGTGAGAQGNGDLQFRRLRSDTANRSQPTFRRFRKSKEMCLPPTTSRRRRTMRVRAIGPNGTVEARVTLALTDKSRAFARGVRRSRAVGATRKSMHGRKQSRSASAATSATSRPRKAHSATRPEATEPRMGSLEGQGDGQAAVH